MTIIAWDGITLAADKRAVINGLSRTLTKIFRLKNGDLFGACGDMTYCLQMLEWVQNGMKPEDFPKEQRDKDDWQVCVVIIEGVLHLFERTPYAIVFEDTFYACGSGRDYAIAAMHLGKTAKEAVEVACIFDTGCGNGVDELRQNQ